VNIALLKNTSQAGLPAGDKLYHFRVESESTPGDVYYVALHYVYDGMAGAVRTHCTCMSAFTNFGKVVGPICKHAFGCAEELMKVTA